MQCPELGAQRRAVFAMLQLDLLHLLFSFLPLVNGCLLEPMVSTAVAMFHHHLADLLTLNQWLLTQQNV